jgi:hypothetical protein
MKKLLFLLPAFLACFHSLAQTDSGSFYLHKFAQNIGRESYIVTHTGNTLTYTVDFKFTDRGQAVPLKTQLVTTTTHEPVSLLIKGSTSRFSTINDSISIQNKKVIIRVDDSLYTETLKPLAFPVGGYSPGTVQMALCNTGKNMENPGQLHYYLPVQSRSAGREKRS